MAEIRHIDTIGLTEGFDIADLVASGVTGDKLIEWCKERLRPGPPVLAPTVREIKNPPAEGSQAAGRDAQKPGKETAQAQTTATAAPVSTRPAVSSNVSALRKPEPEPMLDIPPEYSDDSLADTFSKKYADSLSYVERWGKWMQWDGARWTADDTLAVRDMARNVARKVASEAATRVDLGAKATRIANTISAVRTVSAIEALAKADRRHAASSKQWDKDPWALNTPGGIVDLTTGLIRPARKEDHATKITRVAPGGECPTWLEFLRVATAGDNDLIQFMQRMAGYCLTGSVREHALFFVYGPGGNGKGTFLNTLDWILNDYAKAANMDMFVEQKFAAHPTDVAGLMGARMVTAQETEEGKRWHESRLKAFTGGDPITARFMRQDEFTFMPQFKLVFAGNHKPLLRNVDEAIRRRLYLIPFTVTITAAQRDPQLPDKLRKEAAGILQWCIEGCLDWQNSLLAPPDIVLATTEEYFEEQDTLGQFLEDCCEFKANYTVNVTALYARYVRWAEQVGEYALPRRRWMQAMSGKSYAARKSGVVLFDGLRIIAVDDRQDFRD